MSKWGRDAPSTAGSSDGRTAGLTMDSPSEAAPAALIGVRHQLRLSSIPMRTQPSFPLTHSYFEVVYAPILGPSAVLVARHLARVLEAGDEPATVCPATLSLELGLRSNNEDPLGRRSRLRRAIDRLDHHHVARWFDDQHLGLVSAAPAVSTRTRGTLPPAARHAHDRFLDVIDLRDGQPSLQRPSLDPAEGAES